MKLKNTLSRIAVVTAWSIGGLIALIVLLIVAATLWLTPERLTSIVNREVSENLRADLRASNIRFTLWSTWPHLCIEADSARLTSRALRGLSPDVRSLIPTDADYIASTGVIKGGINILDLIHGRISLTDVSVAGLDVNLVAVNDTLGNYTIIPPDTSKTKIPYFKANDVKLVNPRNIRYFSLADDANLLVELKDASMIREMAEKSGKNSKTKGDRYKLRLIGKVDMEVENFEILRGFPVELDGTVALGFKPFRISTSNYNVSLGNTRGNMDMNMQIGGEMSLDRFSYRIANFNLRELLSQIPGLSIPDIESIYAPLTVNASARLTSPWRFSSSLLPSAEVDFAVADGPVEYTTVSGRRYTLTHHGAGGALLFDGADPDASSFRIDPFSITGEGVDIRMAGSVTRLLGSPKVDLRMQVDAGLHKLAAAFPQIASSGVSAMKGEFKADASLSCLLSPFSRLATSKKVSVAMIDSLELKGDARLDDFSLNIPTRMIAASGKNLDVSFAGSARNSGGNLRPGDLSASISSKKLHADMKGDRLDLSDMTLDLKASPSSAPVKGSGFRIPAQWEADRRSMNFVDHSPEYISADISREMKDIMSQWSPSARLKVKGATLYSKFFPTRNIIRNLDIEGSFDSLALHSLSLRSKSTAMKMKGKIGNLRQFLTSSTPAPLPISLDVKIDTIQINQLARTYENGKKLTEGISYSPSPDTVSAADTVALLIPRNLICDIKASAMQTQYMDLQLDNLGAAVKIADGNLKVDNLTISADFGRAYLNFAYDTGDLQRLEMNADMGLMDINVVDFFKNFHTLLLMMPQMANLEGEVSAEADMHLLAFPNMYINIPSLWADLHVQGDGLTVHQSPFIRHVTRMLLIRNSNDLHIANMNVHASIHDNLLELYPFRFQLENYRLKMMGLNNFDGDLYYHIGVEKSPLHIPFGINVEGNFSHPRIRFGGAGWKVKKGFDITGSVEEEHMVNIIAEAKKYIKEFIHKAAISPQQ